MVWLVFHYAVSKQGDWPVELGACTAFFARNLATISLSWYELHLEQRVLCRDVLVLGKCNQVGRYRCVLCCSHQAAYALVRQKYLDDWNRGGMSIPIPFWVYTLTLNDAFTNMPTEARNYCYAEICIANIKLRYVRFMVVFFFLVRPSFMLVLNQTMQLSKKVYYVVVCKNYDKLGPLWITE